jgi:hypothetical protein
MLDRKIIEEMAKLEEVELLVGTKKPEAHHERFNLNKSSYDYLTDHNAVYRVLKKASPAKLWDIVAILNRELGTQGQVLRATPRQKCEAILKACGRWEAE